MDRKGSPWQAFAAFRGEPDRVYVKTFDEDGLERTYLTGDYPKRNTRSLPGDLGRPGVLFPPVVRAEIFGNLCVHVRVTVRGGSATSGGSTVIGSSPKGIHRSVPGRPFCLSKTLPSYLSASVRCYTLVLLQVHRRWRERCGASARAAKSAPPSRRRCYRGAPRHLPRRPFRRTLPPRGATRSALGWALGREALDSRDPRGIDDSVLPVSVLASRGLGKDTDLMAVPQRPDDDVREARDFFVELLGVPLSERLPDERDDAAEHAADGEVSRTTLRRRPRLEARGIGGGQHGGEQEGEA